MTRTYRRGGNLLLAFAGALLLLAATSAVAAATPTNIPSWRSAGTTIPWGVSKTVSGESNAGLNLQYKGNNKVSISVTCSTLSNTGKVENSAAGKAGTLANASTPGIGPSGNFQDCELVKYGEKDISEGLACTIPKTIPMESGLGTLTNEGNPAGGLRIKAHLKFTVTCPGPSSANWWFDLTSTGQELWQGQQYFAPTSTKVEGTYGNVGEASVTGEVSWGIGVADANGPVTVGQLAYEEPVSTSGSHWYRGGAFRGMSEGLKMLLKEGTSTAITGPVALSLEFATSGVIFKISCGGSVSGNVENLSGGGAGVGNVGLGLTGCAVVTPAGLGCVVNGSSITTKSMPATVQSGTSPAILQLNSPGNEVGSFIISGCSIGAFNHAYTIKGQWLIRPQMKAAKQTGSWLVSSESSKYLTINGQMATPAGEITAENGGEVVTMG